MPLTKGKPARTPTAMEKLLIKKTSRNSPWAKYFFDDPKPSGYLTAWICAGKKAVTHKW